MLCNHQRSLLLTVLLMIGLLVGTIPAYAQSQRTLLPSQAAGNEPTNPAQIYAAEYRSAVVLGSYIYFARGFAISIFNLEDPQHIEQAAHIIWPRGSNLLATNGRLLFSTTNDRQLQVIDISQPTKPVVRSEFPLQAEVRNIAAVENLVYVQLFFDEFRNGVWEQWSMIQIIDFTNPDQPRIRSQIGMPIADAFRIVGSMIYLTIRSPESVAGLQLIDVSNPDAPRLRGKYAGQQAMTIQVLGHYAYFARATVNNSYDAILEVIDVQNPDNLQKVGEMQFSGLRGETFISKGYVLRVYQHVICCY